MSTETVASSVSAEPSTPIVWDAMGHCADCRLSETAVRNVDALIASGKAEPMAVRLGCGHVQLYRSLGWWTNIVDRRGRAQGDST